MGQFEMSAVILVYHSPTARPELNTPLLSDLFQWLIYS